MKKVFENPMINVMSYSVEDVITTSNIGEGSGGEGELPIG